MIYIFVQLSKALQISKMLKYALYNGMFDTKYNMAI